MLQLLPARGGLFACFVAVAGDKIGLDHFPFSVGVLSVFKDVLLDF